MITTVPIKNEKDIAVPDKTVLVLGYFDGIHKGHQKLFEVASKASMKDYLPVVVMTFTESPKLALQPYKPELMLHIVSHEEREHKMKWHGVEALFLLDFSSKFASLTGQEFFDTYVRALKPAIIVAGFDYTFGSDKKTADDLNDYLMEKSSLFRPLRMKRGKLVLLVFVKLFLMEMSGKLVIYLALLYRHVEWLFTEMLVDGLLVTQQQT